MAQKRDIKSAVVIRSTDVAKAFSVNLKQRPISFLLILLTAQISLNVRGTPSCLQAMYKQADALASFERPLRFLPSCTCLNKLLARSTIVFGKLIRSAIVEISLKAAIKARSELLIVRRFWYFAAERWIKNWVKMIVFKKSLIYLWGSHMNLWNMGWEPFLIWAIASQWSPFITYCYLVDVWLTSFLLYFLFCFD